MAKPLGAKASSARRLRIIPTRATRRLPNCSTTQTDDKLKFAANDVAAQKQAMKKGSPTPAPSAPASAAERPAPKKPGRKPGQTAVTTAPRGASAASPVDLIDKTLDLAQQAGGVRALKRLVDRIADMQKR